MKTHIVKIGNSRGIRIPKPILEQTGIKDDIELEVKGARIIIRAVTAPRAGWEDSFRLMSEHNDDEILQVAETISHSWDDEEWEW